MCDQAVLNVVVALSRMRIQSLESTFYQNKEDSSIGNGYIDVLAQGIINRFNIPILFRVQKSLVSV